VRELKTDSLSFRTLVCNEHSYAHFHDLESEDSKGLRNEIPSVNSDTRCMARAWAAKRRAQIDFLVSIQLEQHCQAYLSILFRLFSPA
jgi:hypothetical protein